MIEIHIDASTASQRLDKFLRRYLPEVGSGFLYKQLRKKNITLNHSRAGGSELLHAGDSIQIFFSEETLHKFMGIVPEKKSDKHAVLSSGKKTDDRTSRSVPSLGTSDILFENEQILILNKRAGLLSQKAGPDDYSLVEMLQAYLLDKGELSEERLRLYHPSVVNRLDRNTSGIILAAKTLPAAQMLSACLRDRSVHKYYLALTEGILREPAHISAWLSKDPKTNKVVVQGACSGQRDRSGMRNCIADQAHAAKADTFSQIETEYAPQEYFRLLDTSGKSADFTLLRVKLITGKTHQIRSHLAYIGHPIIGDVKYGRRWRNEEFRQSCGLHRQFLHASEIVFPEMDGALSDLSEKSFSAPLPEDLQRTLQVLKQNDGRFN
ncbi:MAG: RluA family pseudouridine synthase [Bilifractor sp.]